MEDVKFWKKSTHFKNRNSNKVCFSKLEKLYELRAGQILGMYESGKKKIEKNCRGKMIITQADIDSMELRENKKTGEKYYLMAYTLK